LKAECWLGARTVPHAFEEAQVAAGFADSFVVVSAPEIYAEANRSEDSERLLFTTSLETKRSLECNDTGIDIAFWRNGDPQLHGSVVARSPARAQR
jgi:hypothetical protein